MRRERCDGLEIVGGLTGRVGEGIEGVVRAVQGTRTIEGERNVRDRSVRLGDERGGETKNVIVTRNVRLHKTWEC